MKLFLGYRQQSVRFVAALMVSLVAWCGQTMAADSVASDDLSTKIEPYKGPPIFLPEPEQIAAASTVVTTETARKVRRRQNAARGARSVALL